MSKKENPMTLVQPRTTVTVPKVTEIALPNGVTRVEPRSFLSLCLDQENRIKTVSQIHKAIKFLSAVEGAKPGDNVEADPELAGWIVTGFRASRFIPGFVLSKEFRDGGYLTLLEQAEKIMGGDSVKEG